MLTIQTHTYSRSGSFRLQWQPGLRGKIQVEIREPSDAEAAATGTARAPHPVPLHSTLNLVLSRLSTLFDARFCRQR